MSRILDAYATDIFNSPSYYSLSPIGELLPLLSIYGVAYLLIIKHYLSFYLESFSGDDMKVVYHVSCITLTPNFIKYIIYSATTTSIYGIQFYSSFRRRRVLTFCSYTYNALSRERA